MGDQYRSAIFFHDAAQEQAAKKAIAALAKSGELDGPVVTQVVKAPKLPRATTNNGSKRAAAAAATSASASTDRRPHDVKEPAIAGSFVSQRVMVRIGPRVKGTLRLSSSSGITTN